MALWNLKNASYLGLRSYPRCLNLRYEDLLTSPEATIVRIRDQFSLRARAKQFDNVEKSTKEPGKDFTYYRDYYLNERWRQELSAEAVRLINERLDASVARALGYEILAADSIAAT
ncbi:MAG: hypothetical protein D6775_09295 [Caldilineae bacterium]|nr:MAG: hypothetical protein D6775_09295 [Caldilineae bacterium]